MFCANCGERIIENAKFCQKCGTTVVPVNSEQLNAQAYGEQTPLAYPLPVEPVNLSKSKKDKNKTKKAINWLLLFASVLLILSFCFAGYFIYGENKSVYVMEWSSRDPAFRQIVFDTVPIMLISLVFSIIASFFRVRIPTYISSSVIAFFALFNLIYTLIDMRHIIASGEFITFGPGFYLLLGGVVLMVISHFYMRKEDRAIKEYFKVVREKEKTAGIAVQTAMNVEQSQYTQTVQYSEQALQAPIKKKRFVKSLVAVLCVAVIAIPIPFLIMGIVVNSEKKEAEEKQRTILEEYKRYVKVADAENNSGIEIDINRAFGYSIDVKFSNPEMNQSQNNIEVVSDRIYVLDAETREDVPHRIMFTTSTVTITGSSSTTTYYATINLDGSVGRTRFLLICFNGISSEEATGLETPPLFFIIRFGAETSEVLTKIPLKMESLFRMFD